MTGKRTNGEGSIFPYRNGYAAYVWVTTPTGQKGRKYVYGKTREEVYDKWGQLKAKAAKVPISTSSPTVAGYLAYWLAEIIKPNREDSTYSHYELMSRLHVIPGIGKKRIDRLTVRETQTWLNKLPGICQCCAQGKDAKRHRPRCCALGECCQDFPSRRVIEASRGTLRAALTGPSMSGALATASAASHSTTPAAPAARSWPRSTFTRESRWPSSRHSRIALTMGDLHPGSRQGDQERAPAAERLARP